MTRATGVVSEIVIIHVDHKHFKIFIETKIVDLICVKNYVF